MLRGLLFLIPLGCFAIFLYRDSNSVSLEIMECGIIKSCRRAVSVCMQNTFKKRPHEIRSRTEHRKAVELIHLPD